MNFLLVLLASVFISLAWLIPIHYHPWVTYTGELYAFFALITLAALLVKEKVHIPKLTLGLVALAIVPLGQFLFGKVFFFSNALMSSIYILGLWFAIIFGYNLSMGKFNREQTFTTLSYVFLLSGVLTAFIAICQWLNLDEILPGITRLVNARPYANFAQPNNMATFLLMALLACLYLFEKQKIKASVLVSCTFVMLISLALSQSRTSWVACACILAYLGYQQFKGQIIIKWYTLTAWLAVFVGLIFLFPVLGAYLSQFSDAQIKSVDIARRATGDMSRLAIWKQMLHAVEHQPWFGYGWFQSSTAYTTISEYFQGPVWVRSAHNFILDFILWNGAIIGVPFLAYFSYWGYQLQKHVKSTESIIGILMVGVFIVHAMLEFPQNYAYFLLPVGFIIGVIQAQRVLNTDIVVSPVFMKLSFVAGIILLAVIYRDYDVASTRLSQAMKYEKTPEKITNYQPVLLLTEFKHRIEWVKMDPYSKVSPQQIEDISHIVLLYPTSYNMVKFARLLAFNGYEAEAKHQLKMIKIIRKADIPYENILKSEF
ncbi:Wzy polymerase domain-containing protein [Acinetobacter portensis]|uniref:Wzy polymerase domain-containing protein n=1 Tax=Acinetobacter portensis TaxID=1839785 RepID=A0ABY4JZ59_9GAMM|nr:O-antigen ligase family protein [Acinetobacter portensis]MCK7607980.1 Wzy polymerase domain-containing protein [Acinetobacter portensis]MCK7638741.1 Wzy polymerase domain-containing protein [Acinetobacter portensis]UPO23502.1 Wzy polymerase domain-containing protein [Acinetobacter portensis]